MRRNNLFKTILILFFAILAVFNLIPTFQVKPTEEKVAQLKEEISQIIAVPEGKVDSVLCGDIQLGVEDKDADLSEAERTEQLEKDIQTRLRRQLDIADNTKIEKTVPLAIQLRKEYKKLLKNEAKSIKLGLDLQGGTYLVAEVNIPELVHNIAKNKSDFEPVFNEALSIYKTSNRDFIAILTEKLAANNMPLHRFFGEIGQVDDEIRGELDKEVKDAVERNLEILRNRIDQFGVSEPNIQKQGDRRIIIELAGVKDISRAKQLIGTTAELRFQLVESERATEDILNKINRVLREVDETQVAESLDAAPEEAEVDTTAEEVVAEDETVQLADLFKGDEETVEDSAEVDTSSVIVDKNTYKEAPFTSLLRIIRERGNDIYVPKANRAAVNWALSLDKVKEILSDVEFLWGTKPETVAGEEWLRLYLVRKKVELTGKYITNAKVDLGVGGQTSRTGESQVSMTLNNDGARIFADLTDDIIGQKLAIILDNKVGSDPVVKVKIPNGRASIENIGTLQEAKDLALMLRAGSLQAPMEFIEERTVGPSLGQDSVSKGTRAAVIGLIIVALFMIIYYHYFGAIADIALILNLVFLMAVLSGFGLTLTLPGVAGIILTIGMAVDANVLIFERIREEEQTGKTIRAAIENGYGRAFTTILDANVTTLLTALVLFQFGTGPIKGFAVTLFWGIIISMFTAIVITRVILDYFTSRNLIHKIPY